MSEIAGFQRKLSAIVHSAAHAHRLNLLVGDCVNNVKSDGKCLPYCRNYTC